MSNINKYSKLIREKKPNRDINFIYDSSDMTEHEEGDESAQVYHGKQDFQKEARLLQYPIYDSSNDFSLPTLTAKKFKQQYKNYVINQNQQDVLHSLSDSRNDTLFVDKGQVILMSSQFILLLVTCNPVQPASC
nr:uncharacterized protein LOC105849077 isoform X2 [Hydra vulgaris]